MAAEPSGKGTLRCHVPWRLACAGTGWTLRALAWLDSGTTLTAPASTDKDSLAASPTARSIVRSILPSAIPQRACARTLGTSLVAPGPPFEALRLRVFQAGNPCQFIWPSGYANASQARGPFGLELPLKRAAQLR